MIGEAMPVTINCDMGAAFGIYKMGDDEACMPYITHANVACGFHASDPKVMRRTVRLAKKHGIAIGAHPGLPDREGFGRREMKLSRDDVAARWVRSRVFSMPRVSRSATSSRTARCSAWQ
jgi:lactam utilization protein B